MNQIGPSSNIPKGSHYTYTEIGADTDLTSLPPKRLEGILSGTKDITGEILAASYVVSDSAESQEHHSLSVLSLDSGVTMDPFLDVQDEGELFTRVHEVAPGEPRVAEMVITPSLEDLRGKAREYLERLKRGLYLDNDISRFPIHGFIKDEIYKTTRGLIGNDNITEVAVLVKQLSGWCTLLDRITGGKAIALNNLFFETFARGAFGEDSDIWRRHRDHGINVKKVAEFQKKYAIVLEYVQTEKVRYGNSQTIQGILNLIEERLERDQKEALGKQIDFYNSKYHRIVQYIERNKFSQGAVRDVFVGLNELFDQQPSRYEKRDDFFDGFECIAIKASNDTSLRELNKRHYRKMVFRYHPNGFVEKSRHLQGVEIEKTFLCYKEIFRVCNDELYKRIETLYADTRPITQDCEKMIEKVIGVMELATQMDYQGNIEKLIDFTNSLQSFGKIFEQALFDDGSVDYNLLPKVLSFSFSNFTQELISPDIPLPA